MPYRVKKTAKGFGVQNTDSGEWHSKDTTLKKAQGQIALLQAKEHKPGWRPTGKKGRKYKRGAWRKKRG